MTTADALVVHDWDSSLIQVKAHSLGLSGNDHMVTTPSPGLPRPLVYSCSGCSSAAQMANHLALKLDREAIAEMSCIAGVGGGVRGLVNTARSDRPIVALDGCVLACVKACLARAGVRPTTHLVLSDFGVKKRKHADFDPHQAQQVYQEQVLPAVRALADGLAVDPQ